MARFGGWWPYIVFVGFLAYFAMFAGIYCVLPQAWQTHWRSFGPPLGLFGYALIIRRMVTLDAKKRMRLKQSVNRSSRRPD